MLEPGQLVHVNLAGLQAEGVMFQAAVTDWLCRSNLFDEIIGQHWASVIPVLSLLFAPK